MHIYEKVRMYLDDNGFNHTIVAEKAGFPVETFSEMLNGTRTMYVDDLERICWALHEPATVFINPAPGSSTEK